MKKPEGRIGCCMIREKINNMPFAYDIPQHPDDLNREAYWRRKLKEDFDEPEMDDNEEIIEDGDDD